MVLITFGDAVNAALTGKMIANTGWTESCRCAVIVTAQPGDKPAVEGDVIKPHWEVLCNGKSTGVWRPSSDDTLSSEWYIVEE